MDRRINRRITEEERRYNGAILTYRVDELPPGEYRLMTRERCLGCTLDVWKLRQEAAIVVATKLSGEDTTVTPNELLELHVRQKWLIPERIPVAWGSFDKNAGFVASTFWDNTKISNANPGDFDPFRLENNPSLQDRTFFYKMHRYDEDFILSMYNIPQERPQK